MGEYLTIVGWSEFQKYRGKRAGFILDATDQFERGKLTGLSMFTRGVLQELRRLRGRSGENILYDIAHIALATHTIPTDRPHLHHAIDTLISRGVLVVTNQQVDFEKPGEKENKKEIEKEKEKNPSARVAAREPVSDLPKPEPAPKPEPVFAKAYACYPRHIGKRAAEKSWGQAVNREMAKRVAPIVEHEEFIFQKVTEYATACEKYHKAREFIPHMATWLNQDRFLDDPTEWEVTRQEQRNGNARADERHTQSTAEIDSAVAELSRRAAAEDEAKTTSTASRRHVSGMVGRLAKAMPGSGP